MFETAPSPSASCLLAPHGREDAVKLRLLEGEEAEDFRDMLENLSDYNKVCNYTNVLFHLNISVSNFPTGLRFQKKRQKGAFLN